MEKIKKILWAPCAICFSWMAEGKHKPVLSAQTWEPAWRAYGSPLLVYHIFPLWQLLNTSSVPNTFCSFPTTCTLCRDHHNIQLKEIPRDTHDSREPSHVFLKYMTLDIRFCFSSPFAIPSLKCITICAFSSEYQACKLLLQGKKSLKEVTPQRTGSAHCLRGSYYIEYPWEMKCSHQFPTFFGIKVALWVRWSGKRIHWKKKRSMFFVPHLCLCQPELLSILWGSNRATLARKVDCYIQHLGLFTLTEALSFGWLFFFPWTMLK